MNSHQVSGTFLPFWSLLVVHPSRGFFEVRLMDGFACIVFTMVNGSLCVFGGAPLVVCLQYTSVDFCWQRNTHDLSKCKQFVKRSGKHHQHHFDGMQLAHLEIKTQQRQVPNSNRGLAIYSKKPRAIRGPGTIMKTLTTSILLFPGRAFSSFDNHLMKCLYLC